MYSNKQKSEAETMNFTITAEAAQWFKDEFRLQAGDSLQFYVKIYGGIPTPRPSYFLGIRSGETGDSRYKAEAAGINFYFYDADSWFLDEYRLDIVLADGEAHYNFSEQ